MDRETRKVTQPKMNAIDDVDRCDLPSHDRVMLTRISGIHMSRYIVQGKSNFSASNTDWHLSSTHHWLYQLPSL